MHKCYTHKRNTYVSLLNKIVDVTKLRNWHQISSNINDQFQSSLWNPVAGRYHINSYNNLTFFSAWYQAVSFQMVLSSLLLFLSLKYDEHKVIKLYLSHEICSLSKILGEIKTSVGELMFGENNIILNQLSSKIIKYIKWYNYFSINKNSKSIQSGTTKHLSADIDISTCITTNMTYIFFRGIATYWTITVSVEQQHIWHICFQGDNSAPDKFVFRRDINLLLIIS